MAVGRVPPATVCVVTISIHPEAPPAVANLPAPGAFADLLLAGAPATTRARVLALTAAGVPARSIYLDLFAPALEEIGARWQRGEATVAQEHLATATVSALMATLAPLLEVSPPIGRRAILACTDGELHALGLRMVADFLEADGWEVLHLGAKTPAGDLVSLAREMRPDVVGLSTSMTSHLDAAADTVAALRSVAPAPFLLVGGRAYRNHPERAAGVRADAYMPDAGTASRLLRSRFGRTRTRFAHA